MEALANPDCGWFYRRSADDFGAIPGSPIAYWASKSVLRAFKDGIRLNCIADPSAGFQTGAAEKFLFHWWEVSHSDIFKNARNRKDAIMSQKKWFPCKKGGDFRKWYGNDTWIANWCNDGEDIRNNPGSVIRNPDLYFLESITWTKLSSSKIGVRYCPSGFVFDQAGSTMTGETRNLEYLLAFCNSSVAMGFFGFLSPTMTFGVGEMSLMPVLISNRETICALTREVVHLSENEWMQFEETPDFAHHPLI